MCVHIHPGLMMFKDLLHFCTGLCSSQEICILSEMPVQVEKMDPYMTAPVPRGSMSWWRGSHGMHLLHVLGTLHHIKQWKSLSFKTDFERWMCLQNINCLLNIRGVEQNLFLYWGDMTCTQHLVCVLHSHVTCGIKLKQRLVWYWLLKKIKSSSHLTNPGALSFWGTCITGRQEFKYFCASSIQVLNYMTT